MATSRTKNRRLQRKERAMGDKKRGVKDASSERDRLWDQVFDDVMLSGCGSTDACKKRGVPPGSFSMERNKRGITVQQVREAKPSKVVAELSKVVGRVLPAKVPPRTRATRRPPPSVQAAQLQSAQEQICDLRGQVKALNKVVMSFAQNSTRRRKPRN